jgi:NAD-dependent dihydropyrimidine dehydrogenase PreA subunit
MPGLQYLKNVASLSANPELCVGCGLCVEVCPQGVLELEDKRVVVARRDACMECGACMTNCPAQALWVEAGVGCAQAVINSALGRKGNGCCCVAEPRAAQQGLQTNLEAAPPRKSSGCC